MTIEGMIGLFFATIWPFASRKCGDICTDQSLWADCDAWCEFAFEDCARRCFEVGTGRIDFRRAIADTAGARWWRRGGKGGASAV